jgi:hypothetical protein
MISRRVFALGSLGMPVSGLRGQSAQAPPRPPAQPAAGPGGREYRFNGYSVFQGDTAAPTYRIFEPRDPVADMEAGVGPFPVVVLVPGCCEPTGTAMEPGAMRSWIEHIVRRGSVVIYSVYPILDTAMVPDLVRDALEELASGDHVVVDLERVTVAGYSAGGPPAVSIVVDPPTPMSQPRALMLMAPVDVPRDLVPLIPARTHVVVVQAETDPIVRLAPRHFWSELVRSGNVPESRRSLVTLRSDVHGRPVLSGDHAFAATNGGTLGLPFTLDALDWFGTWKYLDALTPCAYDGAMCEYVFGNTPEQRFMGTWTDGVPVREPLVGLDEAT